MKNVSVLSVFAVLLYAVLGSGCAATRFSARERLATVTVDETVVDSFHVEDLLCEVKMEARGGTSPVRIPKSRVNRLLEERFPRSFDQSWQSVPLHIVCSGTIPVSPLEKDDWSLFDCAASLLFYRHADQGVLRIGIKVGGEEQDARSIVEYSRSHSFSFPSPLAAVIPGKGDWRAIRSIHPAGNDCEEALADLVAAGIVKALNGMASFYLVDAATGDSFANGTLRFLPPPGGLAAVRNEDDRAILELAMEREWPVTVALPAPRLSAASPEIGATEPAQGRSEPYRITSIEPKPDMLVVRVTVDDASRTFEIDRRVRPEVRRMFREQFATGPNAARREAVRMAVENEGGSLVYTAEFE